MKSKSCFKCGLIKPLSEFYSHKRMADGHLNKCIACAKNDMSQYLQTKMLDKVYAKKERERCRIKQSAARAAGKVSIPKQESTQKWRSKNREKTNAHVRAARAVADGVLVKPEACQRCEIKTARLEKHHEDYSKPLQVEWLCPKCHGLTKRKDK
jgi:hypothetical protein